MPVPRVGGEELAAEADQAARRDDELHAHPAGAVVRHVLHATLAARQQLGDRAEVLLRRVDREVLERLVGLAVDLLRDHLRLADGELEALAAHVLDEDGEGELSAALHLPRIRTSDVDDLEGDVADELLVETVLDHASGELVALDLAHERGGVGADRHRDGGVVDRDGRQRTHVLGVGDGLADGDVLETGDGDDVAGACGIGRIALECACLQELGDARVLVRAVGTDPGHGLALLERAVEDAQQRETTEERLESRFVTQACSGCSSS